MREGVFELLSAGGVLAGVLWMVNTFDASPADCETRGTDASVVSECLTQAFQQQLYPALGKIAAGWLAGALLAVLLIRTVPGLRRPRAA